MMCGPIDKIHKYGNFWTQNTSYIIDYKVQIVLFHIIDLEFNSY